MAGKGDRNRTRDFKKYWDSPYWKRREESIEHKKIEGEGKMESYLSINTTSGIGVAQYVYWRDNIMWLGFLDEYPDHWTQGETLDELRENLRDLYEELRSDKFKK